MGKGAETRAYILTQAISMAGILGLEGLTIGRLATQTGMSKSGLFGHFGSKEALQFAVLETIAKDFSLKVISPALKEPTGETRLRKLFSNWMEWANDEKQEGGCRLMGASVELNARPGELRDYLAEQQIEWIDCIRRMAQKAVSESIFRAGLDTRQFAFEFHSIGLGLNFSLRLLRDPAALSRSQVAFDSLIQKAKS
jgi:AcrR family transcriptional regulator